MNETIVLDVSNVGKVSSAVVELPGVTVVVGENAMGKSTISRALCAMCSMNFNMSQLVRFERANSICQAFTDSASGFEGGLEVWIKPQPYAIRGWAEVLTEDLWNDRARFVGWIRAYFGKEKTPEARLGWINDGFDDLTGFDRWHESLKQIALGVLDAPHTLYERHVCVKVLNTAYDGQWRNVVSPQDDFHIRVTRGEDVWSVESSEKWSPSCHLEGNRIASAIFYVEPVHGLDLMDGYVFPERYVAGPHNAIAMLRAKPVENPTLEMQRDLDDAKSVLDGIARLIGGKLRQRDDKIVFEESTSTQTRDVSIANMASGMKTMAAVVRAVENGTLKRGGLLVIDEPEANLHPAWQTAFAKFLVLLHREFDMRILLTTHSPYFFKAIRVHADFAGVGDECRYYQMTKDKVREGFTSVDRTEDPAPVYESMMHPYAQLKYGENYVPVEESR